MDKFPGKKHLLSLLVFICFLVFVAGSNATIDGNSDYNQLPVVGTVDNLRKLLLESNANQRQYLEKSKEMQRLSGDSITTTNNSKSEAKYSGTNNQVDGVDEGDLLKNDGEYIYKVNRDKIVIIKAVPVENMQIISQITFDNQQFSPQEIYVDQNKLVLIGIKQNHFDNIPLSSSEVSAKRMYPYYPVVNNTQIIVYDIKDKNYPKKLRDLEIEGQYVSSRKINNALYIVAQRHLPYNIMEQENIILPTYRDSAQGSNFLELSLDKVRYFPGCVTPNYLIVAGLNLAQIQAPAQVESYLGGGENIYASEGNLYIALKENINRGQVIPWVNNNSTIAKEQTKIYRFSLKEGRFNYSGAGNVPGTILNQFSMDEYNDNFRIATTTGDMWRNDELTSKNNVYILDQELKVSGKIEGIAPGEKIYSTRFMGDKAYMVTFRNVDPFFVLDLKNPDNPQVLGKLKIPGYSDYLHPYDENHIIGFGKDTIEMKGWNGESQAYYQGIKIALFDVTDFNNPIEMNKIVIGARGTESELLRNHKALLFNKNRNLLAFPVTVMELKDNNNSNKNINYGKFAFQGAYIFNIDLENGLQIKNRITHLTAEDLKMAGDYWYESPRNVQRILYIGDNLYTISENILLAHDITYMQEQGRLVMQTSK